MHRQWPPAARRDRTGSRQEGSLIDVSFVGSYPTADFPTVPPLPEVAFVGRSNVGKSSLINAIVGRRALARISGQPGKTRMCNVFAVADRYYLVDLPGYGFAKVSLAERKRFRKLVSGYLGTRARLAGVVWLLDIRREPSVDDLAIAGLLSERGRPVLLAMTKGDKMSHAKRRARAHAIRGIVGLPDDQCVVTSARTREGIDQLRESIDDLVHGATN